MFRSPTSRRNSATSVPGALWIDTLNRSLVDSELKEEDMAAYIAAAGKTTASRIVHHCGVEGTRPA
jgi:hypothetical protein